MFSRILKKIHNFFLLFGINISFVKKEINIDTILHNTPEMMDKFWADPKNKKNWLHPELIKFYNQLLDFVRKKNISLDNRIISDMGCGTGTLLYYLLQNYKPSQIFGFEFSEKALDIARKKLPLVTLFQQDLNIPISQKSDIVFCTEVFEHLLEPELVLINILSTLNPNGYLIITVPNGRKDTYEGHINFWSPESWNIFIKKNAPTLYFETGKFNEKILYALIKF